MVLVFETNGTFNESVVCEHYVPNVLVIYEVQPDDSTQTHDLFEENGDVWEAQTQAMIYSESEDEKWT